MHVISFVTLLAVALLAAAATLGGPWPAIAVAYLTVFAGGMDRFSGPTMGDGKRTGTALSVTLGVAHFALLPIVLYGLSAQHLSAANKVLLFFAAGVFFGQISNANAHELIHRSRRWLHRLGMWIYISLLFGHHTSAHVLVHHRHVATPDDPNSSRKGESLYRYIIRAWIGSFMEGFRAEATRLARINRSPWHNPYVIYVGGALCFMATALAVGPSTLFFYVALGGYAQTQLLMSDYVQHYGLKRGTDTTGKTVPVGPQHSWNSPHWFSSALMLNATRHSDHHTNPARPYPKLDLPKDAPMLPRPLPLMAGIALVPPLWRRIMDPLVDRWQHA